MSQPSGLHGRLRHDVPSWVDRLGATFHVRIRVARGCSGALTSERLGPVLLSSVTQYADERRWWPRLFLLMPDHLHALLCFPEGREMSEVIRQWKRWHARTNGVEWQSGYFDHRIRDEENLRQKAEYILNNPVAKQLCQRPEEWSWVIVR